MLDPLSFLKRYVISESSLYVYVLKKTSIRYHDGIKYNMMRTKFNFVPQIKSQKRHNIVKNLATSEGSEGDVFM